MSSTESLKATRRPELDLGDLDGGGGLKRFGLAREGWLGMMGAFTPYQSDVHSWSWKRPITYCRHC